MDTDKARKKYFTAKLMDWHQNTNQRSLPWKAEKDPYKIWLSEIILQQTRAEQGLPYYLAFTGAYPTIKDLAAAKDEDVFRLWQGLGYYNRCKNMLATARIIAGEFNGSFPDTHDSILNLKGIGPYTAAAISSFAYGLPYAVVDGNVYRVLARYFGMETPIDGTEGKKQFSALAADLLHKADSAAYNQAIMDLGATVCTPKAPACTACPLARNCAALAQGIVALLPVKSKKTEVKTRFFHYVLLTHGNNLLIRKRTADDIWQNLYEPYLLIEATSPLATADLLHHDNYKAAGLADTIPEYEGMLRQRLTHRIIETRFFALPLDAEKPAPNNGIWVNFNDLKNYGFPKTIVSFLEKKLYF